MTQPAESINKVLHNLRKLVDCDRLMICCSGGADSMALLFCARKIFTNILVIHAIHDMRSEEESNKDYLFVKEYCAKENLDFESIEVKLRNEEDSATEQEYRAERYDKIVFSCRLYNYPYAATGHHADDQLETLIMKICRGAGLRGLSGIASKVNVGGINFVRPMLDITKEEIVAICKLNNVPYIEDASNYDLKYTRNKIRNTIIPQLKDMFPNCALQATQVGTIASDAQNLVEFEVANLAKYQQEDGKILTDALRLANDTVIYEWIRKSCTVKCKDLSIDAIKYVEVQKVIACIRARNNKKFIWQKNLQISVKSDYVEIAHKDA